MILYAIRFTPNQITLVFLNESHLDGLEAIVNSHCLVADYVELLGDEFVFNQFTLSLGNNLNEYQGYLYHTEVFTLKLEGRNLESDINMLNFKNQIKNLSDEVVESIPFGVAITLEMRVTNKI